MSCVKQQQQHLPQRYLIQAHLTDGHKASEVVYTAYIKKKMGEGRLAAWISNVRFSARNENSYLAPEANCSFSEWVYVNDTDRK